MNPRTAASSENLVGEAATLTAAYQDESSLSKRLYERAEHVMPGGNSRHSVALLPYPAYVERGEGCRVQDVEGAWHATAISATLNAALNATAGISCLACMVVSRLETNAYGEKSTVVEAQLLAVEVLQQRDVDRECDVDVRPRMPPQTRA